MKDVWYGDKRDLVKWSVLVELAARFQAQRILQVLYHRPSIWPEIEIDGRPFALPDAVVQHFRNTTKVRTLRAGAQVELIDDVFIDRRQYLQTVVDNLRRSKARTVVFLDPDTGLESTKPDLTHVLDAEVGAIWKAMTPGDALVAYQHQTNRNGSPWIEPKKQQFERALAIQQGMAKLAYGPKIAADVAFFYCQKPSDSEVHNPSASRIRA